MEQYKIDFIEFLLSADALKLGEFTLKSKRLSPYFINVGDFNEGSTISELGRAYAEAIISTGKEFDVLFGPAYKGVPLAVTTSIALLESGRNTGFTFDRKEAKDHGEATNKDDLQKAMLVGKKIEKGSRMIILDDVFTTGDTKYETINLLNKMADELVYEALIIAVDRQEVGIDGKNAIDEFTEKTEIPVVSIVKATEICSYLSERGMDVSRMHNYLRVYGTIEAKEELGVSLDQQIIKQERSVIPACDVSLEEFEKLVEQTADIPGIGGYKIPGTSGRKGWETWVETARKHTNKPLIYDHQKAATDIPDQGKQFMKDVKESGFDAVILFPQAGPETERAWIYHALNEGLGIIVGGRMTHPAYTQSEGGFITDEGAMEMYRIAARAGISNFVVPGNKIEVIEEVKKVIEAEGVEPIFYSPGFIAQGGKIEDAAKVIGRTWHAIIGKGIFQAPDIRKAATEYTSQM